MNPKFVVSHLDQQLGPFDEETLKAKWAKGEFLPIDYVYDDSKQDWVLLAERFEWANKSPSINPPPIKPEMQKRKVPPPAPGVAAPAAPAPIVPLAPIVAPSLAATAAAPSVSKGAKVKLVDGMGEFDLSPMSPGQVELVLQDSSNMMLKLQAPLRIQVRPAEPEQLVWTIPAHQTVGQDLEITLHAQDGNGALCVHYEDKFIVKVAGGEPREVPIQLQAGVATIRLNHTKTEKWELTLHYSGTRNLRLPLSKIVEWQPGPAVRLILDGPPDLIAGSPLKVQVKAVDQYGNLAKTFQGTVVLEVKAS